MFDLSANPVEIGRHLGRHPQLAPVVQRPPELRLPGAWDEFEVAVRVLVERDVGHVGTAAVMGKLTATYASPGPARDPTSAARVVRGRGARRPCPRSPLAAVVTGAAHAWAAW